MDTATWLGNVRSAIANIVVASAQLRGSGKQCLCTWGQYAFNEHGANVEQNGVHGTTEGVLALHRMAHGVARPNHYTAKFLGGHAALLSFWKDRERADDFVRSVKLFPWITALATYDKALRGKQKLIQLVTESRDCASGGWPFALRGPSGNDQPGEVWPTVLALEALRSLAVTSNDSGVRDGEAFLLEALKSSLDQDKVAGPLLYAVNYQSSWLRRRHVQERLSAFLNERIVFSHAPSQHYSYYPPGSVKAKPSYCTLPVGIYYLRILRAVEAAIPKLVTDTTSVRLEVE